MNVYTRTPSLLEDTVYTAFGDDRALISPRKPQEGKWNLKEKYSDLGGSFLPTGPVSVEANGMDLAEIGRSHQPSKLKIPSTFLQNNAGRDDKAEVKMNNVIDVKKSLKTENNAGRQTVVNGMIRERQQEGSIEDRNGESNVRRNITIKEEENLEDVNRPTSKLIQDNENLQQLFDCVRGKEPSQQEVKSVGKLKLPTTFGAPLQNGKQNENAAVRKGQEVRGSGSMAQAMAMPFDDWIRTKEGDEEEIMDFKRAKASSEVQRDAGANTQGFRNSEYGMSAGNKFKEDRNSQTYVESDAKQYWLRKQNGSLAGNTGVKENINKIHGLNKEGMYGTTSNLTDINGRHSDVSSIVAADRRDRTVSNTVGGLQVDGKIMQNRMNANSFERSMNESEQEKFGKNGDSRSKDETVSARTGTKNIGKLTMPSAFLNSKSEVNSSKREFIQRTVNGGVHQRMGTEKVEHDQSSLTAFKSEGIGKKADRNLEEDPRDLSGFKENLNSNGKQVKEEQNNDSGDIGKSNKVQEKKPVGKLNMHAIFQQKEIKEENKKKEDSMVAKNKAMFDQNGKKADTKQKGVGKLRLGSAKSERYEEIDSLSPAGQLPSNISNEMKEQLEKILQGRSGSVSSQASSSSSSSRKDDAKEVGRLSSSSLSSLNTSMSTPREEDLSARSLEDVFDEDKDDNCGQSKVNSGSLEFQLGNIFQNRKASSNSLSSSTSNSLNTSFNAGSETGISTKEDGFPGNDIKNQASQSVIQKAPPVPEIKDKAEHEKTERRKLITDAIKVKYGTRSGECSEGEHESLRANRKDEVEKITTAETLPKEQEPTFDKFSNLQTEATYNAEILNAKKEVPTENKSKRGRVSIPSVFGVNPEVESSKVRFASQPKSVNKDRETMNVISDVTDNGTPMENNSAAQSMPVKKVSMPSNFLSKHDAGQGNTKDPVLLNRGDSDSSGTASGKFDDNGSISPKKVNFKSEVGIIGNEEDDEKANLKPARSGKLSSSLMQTFQGGKGTDMKPVSMRPPTPGRQSNTKGFFREGWNEIRPETPAIEEEQALKAKNHGTQNILKFDGENSHGTEIVDNNKNDMNWASTSANTPTGNDCEFTASSGQIDNTDVPVKKKVGKLSIPSMFQ